MGSTEGFDELDAKLEKLASMADVIERNVAPQITEAMRNYAIDMVTNVQGAVDTGALRNSIEGATQFVIRSDEATVEMGITATSDHIRYIEFGTGIHGSNVYDDVNGGSHTSEGVTFKPIERWFQHNPEYQGEFGKNNDPRHLAIMKARKGFSVGAIITGFEEWIPRYSQHPRPIMRPALYDNLDLWREMLEGEIGDIFA